MRYVNPKDYGYVSQFIEAPLDYMNKALQSKQESFDKQQLELSEAQKEANLKGGYQTQQLARETAEAYKAKIEKLSKNLTENGSLPGGINAITSARNEFRNNRDVQTIKKDEEAMKLAEQQHLDPTFNKSIQNYYDPKTGYVQRKSGEEFSPEWYKLYKPTDFVKDHQDFYSYLKENLRKTGEATGYEYKEDLEGNPIGWFQKNTNTFVRGITEDDVRPLATKYAANPENAASHESAIYLNQKKLKEQGQELTPEEYIDQLVSNYPGYHSSIENTETEKQLTNGKKDNSNKSKSGSEDNTDEVTDILAETIKSAANSPTNSTVLNNKTMSGMMNGSPDGKGGFNTEMTGRETYLQPGTTRVTNKTEAEQNAKVNDYIILNANYNKVKKEAENEAASKVGLIFGEAPNDIPFKDFKRDVKTLDGKYYVENGGSNNILLQDVNAQPSDIVTKRMTKDEFINYETNNRLILESKRDAKGQPQGKIAMIEDIAKGKGIDLNDKKLKEASLKFNPDQDEKITSAIQAINQISGTRNLKPAAGQNGFLTDNGEFITKNIMTITEAEAEELFGSDGWFQDKGYKKLENLKLISSRKVKSQDGKEDETVYDIPVYNKVSGDVGDLSEQVNNANYQAADGSMPQYYHSEIPKIRANSKAVHTEYVERQKRKNAPVEYEKNYKEADLNFATSTREIINQMQTDLINQGYSKEQAQSESQIYRNYAQQIHNLPTDAGKNPIDNKIHTAEENRKIKALEIHDFNLRLNDPETYKRIKGISDDVGKQNPQTTSSNPLGIQ